MSISAITANSFYTVCIVCNAVTNLPKYRLYMLSTFDTGFKDFLFDKQVSQWKVETSLTMYKLFLETKIDIKVSHQSTDIYIIVV